MKAGAGREQEIKQIQKAILNLQSVSGLVDLAVSLKTFNNVPKIRIQNIESYC